MKDIFKSYFTHHSVLFLWSVFFLLTFVLFKYHIVQHHALWLLLPLPISPFIEWCLHKYVLHLPLPKKDGWLKNFMLDLHHLHHKDPKNISKQFAPLLFIVGLLTLLYLAYALVSQSFAIALVPLTSSVLLYLFYEWMHLAHHTASYQPKTKAGKALKTAHMMHHYTNENYWWGVTSNIADKCLGTYKQRDDVEKSPFVKNISRL